MSSAHLEAEAKERQREALERGNVTKHSDCSIPQIIAEPTKNRDNESAVQAAKMLNHYSTCPYSMSGSIEVA